MKRMGLVFAFVVLLILPRPSPAAELPEPILPAGLGVNIHFNRGHEADLDLIQAAGFKFIRMDLGWGGMERKKGEYDWSAADELMASLDRRHIRALWIFDYSNELYEPAVASVDPVTQKAVRVAPSPQHPESVAAFAQWAAAAAARYKGRHVVWELWNEPNISFWQPKPDIRQYTELARATAKAVRAADPQATIIGPGSSEFPWEFLEQFLGSGILADLDGVSIHPYRSGSPETAAADFARLRSLIARMAPEGKKNLPIISSEWGYSTQTKGLPLDRQASYLVRQHLSNQLNGVPLSIWYDWKNDGPDAAYNENNFGTVTAALQPKPSYLAARTLASQLDGYRVIRRLSASRADDYAVLCLNARNEQKLVAWTTAPEDRQLIIDVGQMSSGAVAGVDIGGNALAPPAVNEGKLTLVLKESPQYVTFRQPSTKLAAAGSWKATLITPWVTAGEKDGLHVALHVKNPFDQPARLIASLTGMSGQPVSVVISIPPKGPAERDLAAMLVKREPSVTLTLDVLFQMERGQGVWEDVARESQQFQVAAANPLALTVAPVEQGMWVDVQNPSGQAWTGQVRVSDREAANISLTPDMKSRRLKLPVVAPTKAFDVQLVNAQGESVVALPRQRWQPVSIPAVRAVLDGDAKVPAKDNLTTVTTPPDKVAADEPPLSSRVMSLQYDFDAGWRFVSCQPVGVKPLPIEGRPEAVGMWVFGDQSGNALRLRVVDASGQTFQPDGPRLDWTGWCWITFPMGTFRSAGHWGGINDGQPHGDLHWDSVLLLDGTRQKTSGTIFFGGVTLIYDGT